MAHIDVGPTSKTLGRKMAAERFLSFPKLSPTSMFMGAVQRCVQLVFTFKNIRPSENRRGSFVLLKIVMQYT